MNIRVVLYLYIYVYIYLFILNEMVRSDSENLGLKLKRRFVVQKNENHKMSFRSSCDKVRCGNASEANT